MSRTPIRCPRCKAPLAWSQGDNVKVIPTAIAHETMPKSLDRVILWCHCGGKRIIVPALEHEAGDRSA